MFNIKAKNKTQLRQATKYQASQPKQKYEP